MQISGQNQNKINPQIQYNSSYNAGNTAPVQPAQNFQEAYVPNPIPAQYPVTNPQYYYPQPQYIQQPQNVQVPASTAGVNIQIFNPSVATPGAMGPTYNVNAPSYPANYYTGQYGCGQCTCAGHNNGVDLSKNPYKPGGMLDPTNSNNPYGADPNNPNNPYRPGGAFDSTNPNNPYKVGANAGTNPNDPNNPSNPYRPGGPLDPNNRNNPYGANPNDPNNPYRPGGKYDPTNPNNPYGAGGLLDPNNPVSPYYQDSSKKTTEQEFTSDTEKKKEKRRIVLLDDNYIRTLENYLNSQDKTTRLNAAKDVFDRLDEDPSRKDDKALTALINKMLQDPSQEIRLIALSALEGRIVNGDDFTVQVLKNMQSNPQGQGFDATDASKILLQMAGKRVDKEVEIDPDKRTKIKTEKNEEKKDKSAIKRK